MRHDSANRAAMALRTHGRRAGVLWHQVVAPPGYRSAFWVQATLADGRGDVVWRTLEEFHTWARAHDVPLDGEEQG